MSDGSRGDMTTLLNLIKKAAVDAVEQSKPMQFTVGKITSKSPLKITVDIKLKLTADNLTMTNTANRHADVGDNVLMIRWQGGQKYVVIDKVV